MKKINKNSWFLMENELSIALVFYYVKINVEFNDKELFYRLTIYKDNKELVVFNFYSLEDAITFTEEVIDKNYVIDDIVMKYRDMFWEKIYKKEK